jgi:hypothetical protein
MDMKRHRNINDLVFASIPMFDRRDHPSVPTCPSRRVAVNGGQGDRDGNLIDTMLSATRDMRAAQRFFRSARSVAGFVPDRVTTDGHNSYPRAIRSTLGHNVRHRTSVSLNNRLEQDHRGIKGRIRCMRGFK